MTDFIKIWNKKFCAEKAGSSGAAERERMLKMLAIGHDKYLEIKSNLQEGTKVGATFVFRKLSFRKPIEGSASDRRRTNNFKTMSVDFSASAESMFPRGGNEKV